MTLSEAFEGENSSLRKTFDEVVARENKDTWREQAGLDTVIAWDKKHKVWVVPDRKMDFAYDMTTKRYEMSTGWNSDKEATYGIEDEEGYSKMTQQEFDEYQNRFAYYQLVQQ